MPSVLAPKKGIFPHRFRDLYDHAPAGYCEYDVDYEALISAHPYRRACSHREAVAELRRCAGTQFDPELSEMFVRMLEALLPELLPAATSNV
jgi:hypothetical protein